MIYYQVAQTNEFLKQRIVSESHSLSDAEDTAGYLKVVTQDTIHLLQVTVDEDYEVDYKVLATYGQED